jgi:hypothetical protein
LSHKQTRKYIRKRKVAYPVKNCGEVKQYENRKTPTRVIS